MTPSDNTLAALIGSRLCHDLVSPLGAIGNGLELLQMMQAPSAEMDLVGEAVKVAQARIRLFRLAFGVATPDQQVNPTELERALHALTANGRITLQSQVADPLPRLAARRLALAALCAETSLAWGGDLAIARDGVTARAARLKIDPDLWTPLSQGKAPEVLASSTVHFALLAGSGRVAVHQSDRELSIRL